VRRGVDIDLEALWNSSTRVRDLVLEQADGPSSLVAALSSVAELLKGHIDAAGANRACWGIRSVLATTLSNFSELGVELELLGFERSTYLIEDQVDAL
jgi:hypothetical protein